MNNHEISKIKKSLYEKKEEDKKRFLECYGFSNETEKNIINYNEFKKDENSYYRELEKRKLHLKVSEVERKIILMEAHKNNHKIKEKLVLEKKLSKVYYSILGNDNKIQDDIDYRIGFYKNNYEILQHLMDKLTIIRTEIAQELGYLTFNELMYDYDNRIDFRGEELNNLYQIISQSISKLSNKLLKKLLISKDIYSLNYKSREKIEIELFEKLEVNESSILKIYENILTKFPYDIGSLAKRIIDEKLFKISRENNQSLCLFSYKYKTPNIIYFCNKGKINLPTIVHEFGHAYQLYKDKGNYRYVLENEPRKEVRELYSIFFEILSIDYIIEAQIWTPQKKADYLINSLIYIPYAVAIDEFQTLVYYQKILGGKRRSNLWRKIICKYNLYDYHSEKNEFLLENTWLMDDELFTTPFGLTNYAIAEIIGLYLYYLCKKEKKDMIETYNKLCTLNHRLSYREIFNQLGVQDPFNLKTLNSMCRFYENLINENLAIKEE